MNKTKYTGWINVFRNTEDDTFFVGEEIFKSKAEAVEEGNLLLDIHTDPVNVIKITWDDDFQNSINTSSYVRKIY